MDEGVVNQAIPIFFEVVALHGDTKNAALPIRRLKSIVSTRRVLFVDADLEESGKEDLKGTARREYVVINRVAAVFSGATFAFALP